MGIALLSFDELFARLQGWMNALTNSHAACNHTATSSHRLARSHPVRGIASRAASAAARPRPTPALRVVRVLDGERATGAGRMVISGRLADVCAELDRLAALEAPAG